MTADVPGHVRQAAVDAAVERIIGAPVADCDPAELIGIRQTVLDVLNTGLAVVGPHLNPAGPEKAGTWEYGIRDPEDGVIIALDEAMARRRSTPGNRVGWELVRRFIGGWRDAPRDQPGETP